MSKNILFVSIFDLTSLFYEIATGLTVRGHRVFWLTTNEYWTQWLTQRGVNRADILELVYNSRDFLSAGEKYALQSEIVTTETVSDLTINEALMMDRFVMYKNKPDINDYVNLYYRDIKRFLLANRISVVVAEPTNINELVAAMLCQELGIPMVAPGDSRLAQPHLVFHRGHRYSDLVAGPGAGAAADGRSVLESVGRLQMRPHYFARNCRIPILSVEMVRKTIRNRLMFMRHTRRQGLTHHELRERLGKSAQRLVGQIYLRTICCYDALDDIKGRIAFFPLHVQPESSIDVLGPYVNNQLELVKNIRRALPFDVTLVVKEHPNVLGLKSPEFFRALRRIPNTKLLKHSVSNYDVYRRASIVFTVSGTPAFEAGMLGIPAVTFAPMYFGGLSSVHFCPEVTRVKVLAERLLNGFRRDFEADCEFMNRFLKSCYECYWTDPVTDPAVLEAGNVARLRAAFADIIESCTERSIAVEHDEIVATV